MVARQHPPRLRHDRCAIRATKKPPSGSETTSACSRATSATRTCGRSTSTRRRPSQSPRDATCTVPGAPSWAPDSKRLVFSAKPTTMLRDYRSDVYIADATGTSDREDQHATPEATSQPQWSPDGASIAWVSEPVDAKPIGDGTFPSYIGTRPPDDLRRRQESGEGRREPRLRCRRRRAAMDRRQPANPVYGAASGPIPKCSASTSRRASTRSSRDRRRCNSDRAAKTATSSPSRWTRRRRRARSTSTDATFTTFRKLTDTNPQAADFRARRDRSRHLEEQRRHGGRRRAAQTCRL